MASDLDNTLAGILGEAPAIEVATEVAVEEVKQNSEVEGVESAAETSQEETEEVEGKNPSIYEEEIKNLDPEMREAIRSIEEDADISAEKKDSLIKSQISAAKKQRANFDRKHTELGEAKKLAETTKELFKEYGLDEKRGFGQIKNLIEFEKRLKSDPKAAIKGLKDMFKIDEEEAGSTEEMDLDYATDNERILFNKIKKAEEEAKKAKEEAFNIKRVSEDREKEEALKEILAFKDKVSDDGSLINPYFDDLLPEMEKLWQLYPNDKIDKLYSKALRLNDELYQKSLEDVEEKVKLRVSIEKQSALAKAKSINSQSFKSKSTSGNVQKSIDDILGDILDNNS
jgi:hypothetical protein